jgi:hypothetical protein
MKQIFFALSLALPISTLTVIPDCFNIREKTNSTLLPEIFPRGYVYQPYTNKNDNRPDLRLNHLEQALHPVTRFESEDHILFAGPRKVAGQPEVTIRAFLDKSTGEIKADELCIQNCGGERQIILRRSAYQEYPVETYNALQALYEKQQADAGEQAGGQEQQENKEEEEREANS